MERPGGGHRAVTSVAGCTALRSGGRLFGRVADPRVGFMNPAPTRRSPMQALSRRSACALALSLCLTLLAVEAALAQTQCRASGSLPGLERLGGTWSALGQLGSRPLLDGRLSDLAASAGASPGPRCESTPDGGLATDPASRPAAQPSLVAGNPVDILTGAKHDRVVDLILPTTDSLTAVDAAGRPDPATVVSVAGLDDGLSLVFARHYSSSQSYALALGPGWSHSFETRLARQILGPAPRATSASLPPVRLQLLQGDGRRVIFAPVAPLETPNRGLRFASPDLHDGLIEERHGPGGRTWLWRWPSGRTVEFDQRGRMIEIEAPDRDRLSLRYTADGKLDSVTDRHGRKVRFEYRAGRLSALLLPDDGRIAYLYDEARRLVGVRQPDGRLTRYHYEDPRGQHWLTGITEADGRRSHYRYDAEGRVLESQPAGQGESLRFSYHGTEEAGHTTVQWRDSRSIYHRGAQAGLPVLVRAEGPGCPVCPATGLHYRRDSAGRLVEQGRWQFSYDQQGRLTRLSDGSGEDAPTWTVHYATPDPLAPASLIEAPSVVPGQRRRLEWVHNERGQPLRISERGFAPGPEGPQAITRVVRFAYLTEGPAIGKRSVIERLAVDANGPVATTRLVWSSEGMLVALLHPEGIEHRIERDGLGRPVREQLPDGTTVQRSFDPGWRLAHLRSAGLDLRWSWQANGQLGEVRFADGERWVLEDKSEHRTLWTASGRQYRFSTAAALSALGAPGGSPNAHGPRRTADPPGGVLPQALTIEGVSTRVVDIDGRFSEFVRDDFGRTVLEHSSVAGRRWLSYDALGRIARIREADLREIYLRHDAAGRLIEREERGGGSSLITRLGWVGTRLVAVSHPHESLRLAHDSAGRLRRIERTDPSGRVLSFELRRDELGRLVERELGDGLTLRTDYDRYGRPAALFLQIPGLGSGYALVERRWRADGTVQSDLIGPGLIDRHELRDASGAPAGVSWVRRHDRQPLGHWRLRRDAHGRVLAIAHREGEDRFGYDPFGRLIIRERADGDREYFLHSAGGDLLARKHPGGFSSVAAGLGRPQARAEWQLEYGASGRIERARTSRAQGLSDPGPGTVRAPSADRVLTTQELRQSFNAFGERTLKTVVDAAGNKHTTGFLHYGQRLAAELDGQGRIVRHYLYWQGQPLALVEVDPARPGRVLGLVHLITDHLGTPHRALDGAGRVVWEGRYDSVGALIGEHGKLRQPLRLPGQYEDREIGLHDNYLRTYDPRQGRYLEPDPLGLAGGFNRYAYVDGNPHLASDPLGLLLFAFDGTGNGYPARAPDTLSNVARLFSLYQGDDGRYMTGVGLDDPTTGIRATLMDRYDAGSARARVDAMLATLDARLNATPATAKPVQIDIIGFSRGAAMARDFANTVAARIRNGHYATLQRCVNLNFVGLWDTVAQFGLNGLANDQWNLSVPPEARVVVHAVAANEHRRFFPLESILPARSAHSPSGATGLTAAAGAAGIRSTASATPSRLRVERSFIGDHADIGGSHSEGDLADVTLTWMYQHARAAGVDLAALDPAWQIVSEPLVHDSRSITRPGPDREVRFGDPASGPTRAVPQRALSGAGLSWQQTQDLIRHYRKPRAGESAMIVGEVDIAAYADWLEEQYGLRIGF